MAAALPQRQDERGREGWLGIQPPNDGLVTYIVGLLVLMAVLWFGVARRRFPGPPVGAVLARRRAEIVAAEAALAETL